MEVFPPAGSDHPVRGNQNARQSWDQSGHQRKEALEDIKQAECRKQRTDAAGDARRNLEPAFVKAEQVAQSQPAGVGVRDVCCPCGQYKGNESDERNAEGGKDGGNVGPARDDAHESTRDQHEQAGGKNADDGRLHNVAAALRKATVVGGNNAAKGKRRNDHGNAEHHARGLARIVAGNDRAAVIRHDAGNQAVQADDDQQRNGNVVEPLEALEAETGRSQHNQTPDDGACGNERRRRLHAQHAADHTGKRTAARCGLNAEPADAGNCEQCADDVACPLLAQGAGCHDGNRQSRVTRLHADEDHVGADEAVADQNGQDDFRHAQSSSDQNTADHQTRHADHATGPDSGN